MIPGALIAAVLVVGLLLLAVVAVGLAKAGRLGRVDAVLAAATGGAR